MTLKELTAGLEAKLGCKARTSSGGNGLELLFVCPDCKRRKLYVNPSFRQWIPSMTRISPSERRSFSPVNTRFPETKSYVGTLISLPSSRAFISLLKYSRSIASRHSKSFFPFSSTGSSSLGIK